MATQALADDPAALGAALVAAHAQAHRRRLVDLEALASWEAFARCARALVMLGRAGMADRMGREIARLIDDHNDLASQALLLAARLGCPTTARRVTVAEVLAWIDAGTPEPGTDGEAEAEAPGA